MQQVLQVLQLQQLLAADFSAFRYFAFNIYAAYLHPVNPHLLAFVYFAGMHQARSAQLLNSLRLGDLAQSLTRPGPAMGC